MASLDVFESTIAGLGRRRSRRQLPQGLEKSGFEDEKTESSRWKIDQILYGRNHTPRFTFFVAAVNQS